MTVHPSSNLTQHNLSDRVSIQICTCFRNCVYKAPSLAWWHLSPGLTVCLNPAVPPPLCLPSHRSKGHQDTHSSKEKEASQQSPTMTSTPLSPKCSVDVSMQRTCIYTRLCFHALSMKTEKGMSVRCPWGST